MLFCILAAGSTDSGSGTRSSSDTDSVSNTFTVATEPPAPSGGSSTKDNEEKVYNSRFDNSVWQVEEYVESKAKNPKSIKWISWGNVSKVSGQSYTYSVQCQHTEINNFDSQVTLTQTYYLDSQGTVINYINL